MTTLTVLSIKRPKWSNKYHTTIDALVTFAELGEVEFTASKKDDTEHTRYIWNYITQGKAGDIAEYVEHIVSNDEIEKHIRKERDVLLFASDWTQLPDVPESTKLKWAEYRQQLRDIPQQKEFPHNIEWPTKP